RAVGRPCPPRRPADDSVVCLRMAKPDTARWRAWELGLVLGLVAATYGVYGAVRDYGFVEVDDTVLTRDDAPFLESAPLLDAFSTRFFRDGRASSFYYRPLVTLSFMLDARRASASDAGAFHATNVALHALAAMLLYALARRARLSLVLAAAVAGL